MLTGSSPAETEISQMLVTGPSPVRACEAETQPPEKPSVNTASNPIDELGPQRLRMHLLYFERLAHHIRSKISVPSAVLRDQLSGAALAPEDYRDGADALSEVLSTLGALDWGLESDSLAEPPMPLDQALEGVESSLAAQCGLHGVKFAGIDAATGEDRLLIQPKQFVRIVAALCRYLGSFTTLTPESLGSACSIRLVPGHRLNGQILICCEPPGSKLRQTRLARYGGRSWSLDQVIDLDHASPSLLLFAPYAVLSACGLAARFDPAGAKLIFRIFSLHTAAEAG